MSVWGNKNRKSTSSSCDEILKRIESNDPTLKEVVILPLKKFDSKDLIRLAKCLDQNTNLQSFHASGHYIDDPEAFEIFGKAIASSLPSTLVDIAVGDSNMGDDGICAFCRGLQNRGGDNDGDDDNDYAKQLGLNSVDLSWKGFGPKGMKSIFATFANQSSLRSLNLSRNQNVGPLFDFVVNNATTTTTTILFPHLMYLDLSDCHLNTQSCTSLVRALSCNRNNNNNNNGSSVNNTNIAHMLALQLNYNDLSDINHIQEMMNIIMQQDSPISEFYISNCKFNDSGIQALTKACCCYETTYGDNDSFDNQKRRRLIEVLDISYNNISSSSIKHFASQLIQQQQYTMKNNHCYLSHLTKLNLAGNSLDERSCRNLKQAMINGPLYSLEELDVSHTSCSVMGAIEFIKYDQSTKLRTLNLFGNQLQSDGFVEISKYLHGGHPRVESLDLGGNAATEAGVVALLQAFTMGCNDNESDRSNKKNALKLLVVGGNQGGTTVETLIKEIQKIYPDLDIARDKIRRIP